MDILLEFGGLQALSGVDLGRALAMEPQLLMLDGPSERLLENEDIKEFYLGLSRMGKRRSYREVKHYRRRKRWLA